MGFCQGQFICRIKKLNWVQLVKLIFVRLFKLVSAALTSSLTIPSFTTYPWLIIYNVKEPKSLEISSRKKIWKIFWIERNPIFIRLRKRLERNGEGNILAFQGELFENFIKFIHILFWFPFVYFSLSLIWMLICVTLSLYPMIQIYFIIQIKFCVQRSPIELFRGALPKIKRNVLDPLKWKFRNNNFNCNFGLFSSTVEVILKTSVTVNIVNTDKFIWLIWFAWKGLMIFILAKTDLFSVVYGKVIKIVPQTKTVILGNYKTFQRSLLDQN